uniref:Uncharacterized protein n=1 Tax=Anguilla anguilla TaxID=7936 RepID=A0A0E9WXY9_ANGAN
MPTAWSHFPLSHKYYRDHFEMAMITFIIPPYIQQLCCSHTSNWDHGLWILPIQVECFCIVRFCVFFFSFYCIFNVLSSPNRSPCTGCYYRSHISNR